MQDLGHSIFVQSDDRCDDGCKSLSERAKARLGQVKNRDEYARLACETWLDVRSFGQVFAFKSSDKNGVSVGVRGPVSIHQAVSVSPVEVKSYQITKSVNGEPDEKRSSDTMGSKHMVLLWSVPDQRLHQCSACPKDRLYAGGRRSRPGMPAHPV